MKKGTLKYLLAAPILISTVLMSACGGRVKLGPADTDQLDVTVDTRGVTITMWTGFGSDMTKQLEEVLEGFTKKTGIIVKHESKSGYPNLLKAINLSSTSGSYPNIANGYPDHFASYVKSNILLRLDGLIANDHLRGETEGNYTQNGVKFDKDGIMMLNYNDFYKDYTVENETLEFKSDGTGYTLGLPFNKSTEVMVYNADLFDWAAANPDLVKTLLNDQNAVIKVPETWAEVRTVGENIIKLVTPLFKVGETKGKILGSDGKYYESSDAVTNAGAKVVMNMTDVLEKDFRPFTYDANANLFITLVRQFGGQYTEVDKTQTGKGYAVFNNATTVEAMTMLQGLMNDKIFAVPSYYEELYCSNAFKAYKSVMNVGSTAGLANITSTAIKTKCTHIPYQDAEHKYVISQGTSLGLFNKGTEKEKVAAWKLMVYLTQQANGDFAARTGYFPTCDYSYNSEDYQLYLDNDFKSDTDVLRQASAAVNAEQYVGGGWNKFVDPGFRGSADIREKVENIPNYIIANEFGGDIQKILDEVCKSISSYIKPN